MNRNFKSKLLFKLGQKKNKKALKQSALKAFNESKTNNWFFQVEKFFARFLSTVLDGGRFHSESSQIIYGFDFVYFNRALVFVLQATSWWNITISKIQRDILKRRHVWTDERVQFVFDTTKFIQLSLIRFWLVIGKGNSFFIVKMIRKTNKLKLNSLNVSKTDGYDVLMTMQLRPFMTENLLDFVLSTLKLLDDYNEVNWMTSIRIHSYSINIFKAIKDNWYV